MELREENSSSVISTMVIIALAAMFIGILLFHDFKAMLIVKTGSMEPAIKTNSIIIIRNNNIQDIEVGDIICYKNTKNENIVHRVVEIYTNEENGNILITKGDANNKNDESPVTYSNYIGKVGFSIWIPDIFMELIQAVFPKVLAILIVILGLITGKKIKEDGLNGNKE